MAKAKTGKAMALGAGLAVAAIGAALGTYFLTGTRSENSKKVLKGWMLKAKGEILEKLEKMEEVGQSTYEKVVNEVAQKYTKLGVNKKEVDNVVAELKKQWKNVQERLKTR